MRVLLLLVLAAATQTVLAQNLHNKGLISISPNTIFHVGGNLTNETEGVITNNGDMQIGGTWLNNGLYNAGNGTITFNSPNPQVINHNAQSFSRLALTGGGEKIFSADLTIEESLQLQGSILRSQNGAKIVLQQSVTITGGSNQSHIVGAVEHRGTGNWLFPVGNGTLYLPVQITGVTDASAEATLLLHEITNEVLTSDMDITKISDKRYWELTVNNGSLAQSKITLPLASEDALHTNSDLWVIAQSETSIGPYSSIGQSAITGDRTSGSITSEDAPSLLFLTAASLTDDTSLHVFNGVSPGTDNLNPIMRIQNIQYYPNNKVTIFNRWGDRVFEISGYDNDQKAFKGESNLGNQNKLPSGTYFYSIDKGDGSKKQTGYVEVRY